MLPCHQYQRRKCEELLLRPIINIACKEDPAKISDFDCVNVDIRDFDVQENVSLYSLPRFVQGSAFELSSIFAQEQFGIAVLGEFLEHVSESLGGKALLEIREILKDDGYVVITAPRDSRPPEAQHPPHQLITYLPGCHSWHHTVWTREKFANLIDMAGFTELEHHHEELQYWYCDSGFGAVLQKKL